MDVDMIHPMTMPLWKYLMAAALLAPLSGLPAAQGADAVQQSVQLTEKNNRAEQGAQQRIEKLSDATRQMLEEYQTLSRELDALTIYNNQVERLLQSQEQEKASLKQQLADIELTQRELVPLMLRMIDALDRFVAEDMPFLRQEREQRVTLLRELMDRADVAVAEKYRRILEAYQIEMDYGRTIEAYRDELDDGGVKRTVAFVRVGRIGLYFQSLDGAQSGYWDRAAAQWVALNGADSLQIRQALRIARKQAAPDLLRLQIPAPERQQP
jgi:septal ring factor EnvC (AmiA/AmiB activator)